MSEAVKARNVCVRMHQGDVLDAWSCYLACRPRATHWRPFRRLGRRRCKPGHIAYAPRLHLGGPLSYPLGRLLGGLDTFICELH
jgi:hypothetical protein